jgi:hypothetical protein
MLHILCPGCLTSAYIDCACPPGWDPVTRGHVTAAIAAIAVAAAGAPVAPCPAGDLDAAITCPPGSPCCQEDHHHGEAANACPGGHADCPEPGTCLVWKRTQASVHPDEPLPRHLAGDCPGGHCHKDLPDCTACRPLIITMVPGSTEVQLTAALRA